MTTFVLYEYDDHLYEYDDDLVQVLIITGVTAVATPTSDSRGIVAVEVVIDDYVKGWPWWYIIT